MTKFNTITANIIFALQVLLFFLVLFESRIELPPLVQTFGRMHPLLLHLPIGLLILTGLFPFLQKEAENKTYRKIQGFILYLTSLTAVMTALFGLFLAQEGGYGDGLARHKWTGIVLSWLTYGLLLLHVHWPERDRLFKAGTIVSLVIVVLTGHFGADLTHGKGYLLAPMKKEKAAEITENTTVYAAAIQPVFKAKCYNCHNERKSKGKLVMTSPEQLLEGGENGPLWMAGDANNSHLIQRANLPLEHEEHMPPEGKPQLTQAEIQMLSAWIQAGANLNQTLGELSPTDDLRQRIQPILEQAAKKRKPRQQYDFKPASPKVIESLNNPFRSVMPVAANSPALNANIFVRQAYEAPYLNELSAVKTQLVTLNLSNLPITDQDLATIAQFSNLEELILNGTDITGATLSELSANKKLRSLAISNTASGTNLGDALPKLTALEELFLWNTGLNADKMAGLQKQFPNLVLHTGYQPDSEDKLALSPPTLENKTQVLRAEEKVVLKQNLSGAIIRYTTDGSEPDSLESPIYEGPFTVDGTTTVKAKVYLEGWLSSPMAEFNLFKSGWQADSIIFDEKPDPQYPAQGVISLQDNVKGERVNFRSGAWLGYRDAPFSAYFFFDQPEKPLEKIVLSYLQNMGSYIMPPEYVEIWAGNDPSDLQLLTKTSLEKPEKYLPNTVKALSLEFAPANFKCYKIIAERVKKLPAWHNGAGDKGWVFVDEVFFY